MRLPVMLVVLAIGTAGLAVRPAEAETLAALQPPPLNLYFGTTHAHTGAENDHGKDASRAADVFRAAKAGNYDFLFLTEHSGPTGPKSPDVYWADAQAQATSFTTNGEFVGFAGYEYSDNSGDGDTDNGHLTAFGTTAFVDAMAAGNNFTSFGNYLVAQAADHTTFGVFNHPPAAGHGASRAALLTPARRSVMALSETSNAVGYNRADENAFYAGFVKHLDRGWKTSPTCGMDSHAIAPLLYAETTSRKPCRTGVLAGALTRADVLEAVLARRTYSTRDINLRAQYAANGQWMGSTLARTSAVALDITVTDPDVSTHADRVTKLEVIGHSGAILASRAFSTHAVQWQVTVDPKTSPYLFVRVFNGERSAHTAVLAPIWFE